MNGPHNFSATLFTLLILVFCGCKPEKKADTFNPELSRIDSLEKALNASINASPADPDLTLAMRLAKAYQDYQASHPDDSLSARFLFKSGKIIEGVFGDQRRAAELYFSVFTKYPQSKSAPYALFMTGNLYHTASDTTRAVEMLNFFLAKYPDHELKSDAVSLIQSMGGTADTTSRPVKKMEGGI